MKVETCIFQLTVSQTLLSALSILEWWRSTQGRIQGRGWTNRSHCTHKIANKTSLTELNKSAIIDHVATKNHVIGWEDTEILEREINLNNRRVREAIWIIIGPGHHEQTRVGHKSQSRVRSIQQLPLTLPAVLIKLTATTAKLSTGHVSFHLHFFLIFSKEHHHMLHRLDLNNLFTKKGKGLS